MVTSRAVEQVVRGLGPSLTEVVWLNRKISLDQETHSSLYIYHYIIL
jgi:hypothetical protein